MILQYVVFLDVLEREGEVLERELLNQYGGLKAKFIKCDITDEEQLLSAYNQVLEKYRRIDAVINNVMVANNDNLEKMIDASYVSRIILLIFLGTYTILQLIVIHVICTVF